MALQSSSSRTNAIPVGVLVNHVTDIPRTCPKCNQPIFVKNGRVSQCSVCQANQVHADTYSGEKWRNCPNCTLLFQAPPIQVVSCPKCQTNQIHQDDDGIVKWERDSSAPQVHTELSQQETPLQSTGGPRRTALAILFSWWQPYQAAFEVFCVTFWPTSLFTFTTEGRRALRLAGLGNYKFKEINDPRIAKWLAHRGGSSALNGLETIQPAIAKQIVKTSDSLRLSGIQYLDESLAHGLAGHSGRTLYLDNLHHVDLEVLEILITHAGRGLSLDGIKNLSIQEASVLARYRGRLSLNNLSNLNSEILAALVQHTGKSISFGSLDTLTQPQARQLKKYGGDLYLRGIPELPPGIDSEFIEFPGKIVLMHHERRPIQTYASGDAPAEDLAARIAMGIVTFVCMAALFALLIAALSNF